MQIERRAEASDQSQLVATFVNVGALATLISNRDHQIMLGRRGTGKTHAFQYLHDDRRRRGDAAVYIDMRTIGSSIGIYTDQTRSLPERATTLLRDFFAATHEGLLAFVVDTPAINLAEAGPVLDVLAETISATRVIGDVSVKDATRSSISAKDSVSAEISMNGAIPHFGGKLQSGDTREDGQEKALEYKLNPHPSVIFGDISGALRKFTEVIGSRRVWLLIDEWSTVPTDLQPYLADLIRRALLPVPNVTVKIAAIEHRTRFRQIPTDGAYIGIEVGADMAADINLDDFMVFENDPTRATAFFADLLLRHYQAIVSEGPPITADKLISAAFTQRNAFDELVRASEGVPRDAINVLNLAAQKALDDRITVQHVRTAARDWYQRDKSRALTEHAELDSILNWIIDEVIGTRRSRAFLLASNLSDSRVEELFDARILHVLKKNVSSKDRPGFRYRVYKIDYGCYVDLISTAKSPTRLFEADTVDREDVDVDVPNDDYRSIRRAILDISLYQSATAAPATS